MNREIDDIYFQCNVCVSIMYVLLHFFSLSVLRKLLKQVKPSKAWLFEASLFCGEEGVDLSPPSS